MNYKNTFINEIGNKITVKVKKAKDTGTNYKTKDKYKFDAVNLELIGPTSISGNVITYLEAREMYKALGKFLKENKMKKMKKCSKIK